jgi:hypothetical protein
MSPADDPCIFISAFHPFISRNILRTKILSGLAESHRIVLLVPRNKEESYRAEFGRLVTVEGIDTAPSRTRWSGLLFKKLPRAMLGVAGIYVMPGRAKHLSPLRRTLIIVFHAVAHALGRFRVVRRFVRKLDTYFVQDERFAVFFDRYHPLVVFATDVQNEYDVYLMRAGKRRRIPVVGMVRSWDNLGVLGMLRVIPDKLLVGSEILKRQAIELHDVPEQCVPPVGVPHYDEYQQEAIGSHEDLVDLYLLDPSLPIVVYAPVGDMYLHENDVDIAVLRTLAHLDANIIVRMPPTDSVALEGFVSPPNMAFDQPGVSMDGSRADVGRNEIGEDDERRLRMELAHADVVVTGPSTIIIDAAMVDTPIVLLGFDGTPKPYGRSVRRLYDLPHLKPVMRTGGARYAKSREELIEMIKDYLKDPTLDKERRKHVVDTECYKFDDRASCDRVVHAIQEMI